jgi:Mg/Co/Ni transporter MgtE
LEVLRARVQELEALLEANQGLCEVLDDEEGPGVTFSVAVQRRAKWLIGLLVAQSLSSSVLEGNEELLRASPVIIVFLTMLVGAGGNAGNQAAVRIVRGLATGAVGRDNSSAAAAVRREAAMAAVLAAVMFAAGLARTLWSGAAPEEALAVSISLSAIVGTAVLAGATIPLALNRVGVDAAHATTIVQVTAAVTGNGR